MTYRGARPYGGYGDDFRARHEADERERKRQEAADRAENDRLRAARLKRLDEER